MQSSFVPTALLISWGRPSTGQNLQVLAKISAGKQATGSSGWAEGQSWNSWKRNNGSFQEVFFPASASQLWHTRIIRERIIRFVPRLWESDSFNAEVWRLYFETLLMKEKPSLHLCSSALQGADCSGIPLIAYLFPSKMHNRSFKKSKICPIGSFCQESRSVGEVACLKPKTAFKNAAPMQWLCSHVIMNHPVFTVFCAADEGHSDGSVCLCTL